MSFCDPGSRFLCIVFRDPEHGVELKKFVEFALGNAGLPILDEGPDAIIANKAQSIEL